jgi:hypothetical protein
MNAVTTEVRKMQMVGNETKVLIISFCANGYGKMYEETV